MEKQTTKERHASTVVWDSLEEWVRKKVQEFIQSKEEVLAVAWHLHPY